VLNLPCGEWVHVDRENVGIGILLGGLDGPVKPTSLPQKSCISTKAHHAPEPDLRNGQLNN
jgi:hypothetical protein